jgi:hypothetical protein
LAHLPICYIFLEKTGEIGFNPYKLNRYLPT